MLHTLRIWLRRSLLTGLALTIIALAVAGQKPEYPLMEMLQTAYIPLAFVAGVVFAGHLVVAALLWIFIIPQQPTTEQD